MAQHSEGQVKREHLEQAVKASFQFELDTLVGLLEATHGDATEFKSVKKAVMIGEHGTHRWVDPPEKVEYLKTLKATLREYVREGCEDAAVHLLDPIITAYYVRSRAKAPIKGKYKDPMKAE